MGSIVNCMYALHGWLPYPVLWMCASLYVQLSGMRSIYVSPMLPSINVTLSDITMEVITRRFFVTLLRHVKTVFLQFYYNAKIGPQREGLARCQPCTAASSRQSCAPPPPRRRRRRPYVGVAPAPFSWPVHVMLYTSYIDVARFLWCRLQWSLNIDKKQ